MQARRRTDNGRWIIDWRDTSGRRHRITLPDPGLTRAQAESLGARLRLEREAEAAVQQRRAAAGPTVAELLSRYWEEHGKLLASAPSERAYLSAWADALGDDTPIAELTVARISAAVARWRTVPSVWPGRRQARLVSDSTVNRRLSALQRILGRAGDLWEWPTPRVPWGKLRLHEPDPRDRSLREAEVWRYLDALPARSRPITLLALHTGLRLGALMRLTARDIDWRAGMIRAISKGRAGGRPTPVPITQAVLATFTMMVKLPEVGSIFAPLTRDQLRNDREAARAATGLSDLRFHDLRHTFAQALEDAGEGDVISAALHHTDPRLRQRYSHARAELVRERLDRAARRRG